MTTSAREVLRELLEELKHGAALQAHLANDQVLSESMRQSYARVAGINHDRASALSALIAECEWRDIASAPKDGTAILAFHTGFLGNHEGRDTGCVVVARNGYDRTWDIVGSGQEYEAWNLTHWRPLPAAPHGKD